MGLKRFPRTGPSGGAKNGSEPPRQVGRSRPLNAGGLEPDERGTFGHGPPTLPTARHHEREFGGVAAGPSASRRRTPWSGRMMKRDEDGPGERRTYGPFRHGGIGRIPRYRFDSNGGPPPPMAIDQARPDPSRGDGPEVVRERERHDHDRYGWKAAPSALGVDGPASRQRVGRDDQDPDPRCDRSTERVVDRHDDPRTARVVTSQPGLQTAATGLERFERPPVGFGVESEVALRGEADRDLATDPKRGFEEALVPEMEVIEGPSEHRTAIPPHGGPRPRGRRRGRRSPRARPSRRGCTCRSSASGGVLPASRGSSSSRFRRRDRRPDRKLCSGDGRLHCPRAGTRPRALKSGCRCRVRCEEVGAGAAFAPRRSCGGRGGWRGRPRTSRMASRGLADG
jgi:hypothetical protein